MCRCYLAVVGQLIMFVHVLLVQSRPSGQYILMVPAFVLICARRPVGVELQKLFLYRKLNSSEFLAWGRHAGCMIGFLRALVIS